MADYDFKLGNVDVDFGGLGALGELAELISPKVADLVAAKIREVMEGDVKNPRAFCNYIAHKLVQLLLIVHR